MNQQIFRPSTIAVMTVGAKRGFSVMAAGENCARPGQLPWSSWKQQTEESRESLPTRRAQLSRTPSPLL